MKKILLIALALMMGFSGFSQSRRASVRSALQDLSLPERGIIKDLNGPVQNSNPFVSTMANRLADEIGNTFYDTQTNGTISQRIYVTEDGKEAAVWTRGITPSSYSDRGTGYNYFDGSSWGPSPTQRIEPMRTGWPSIARWNGGGEVVIAHQSFGEMQLSKRPVAGSGAWTTTPVPYPTGVMDPGWPSIMTSGENNQHIHILGLSTPTSSGGGIYNGLDGAVLYWRSSDGGATWDKEGIILPGMESPEYFGFSPDSYAWAPPKGDTIAFACGDSWTDEFIMYSYDNGETWNKTIVLSNQYKGQAPGTIVLPFYATDGSSSLDIDENGVFHLAFGRMRVSEESDGRKWYPYTDGLIYWNSNMPQLQDSLNLDTLDANGQLVGYVYENTQGDTIISIAIYNVGMSSYPSITVDDSDGRIYVAYSGVVVGNPNNDINFRHIIARGCNDYQTNYTSPTWGDFYDANTGIDDLYIEYIFPSMAKNTTATKVHYVVQSSDVPGSNIITPATVSVHDNLILHNEILKDDIIVVNGVNEIQNTAVAATKNFPNPFSGNTTIFIQMKNAANATLEVTSMTGQVVRSVDLGTLHAGTNQVGFDASGLTAGIYLYSVKANGVARTNRMVIK